MKKDDNMYTLPTLNTDNASIDLVYRIALGDIYSNVVSFRDGLLKSQSPVLLAGAGYHTPLDAGRRHQYLERLRTDYS